MSNISYRPDIDGLRAIAVLSVIGFHAFPEFVPGGFVGVDIFFVISGFLISSILLRDADSDGISIRHFYAKRILRIFPALAIVILACLIFGWHTLLGNEYKQLGRHIFSSSLFAANFQFWSEASYFDNLAGTKPLLHLWSLCIEEQFYFIWPLLLISLLRLGLLSRWLITALLLLSLAYSGFEVFSDRTAAFYSPFSRAWELLAGCLLAFANERQQACRSARATFIWAASGLVCVLLSIAGMQSKYPFPGLGAVPVILGTLLLIGAGPSNPLSDRILSHPALVGVGRISYPLYLWHWPLLSFAMILGSGSGSWEFRLALVLASLALATATYLGLEKPLRRLPRKLSIGLLIVFMSLLALLGNNIYRREGLAEIRYKGMIELQAESQRDFVDWEKSGLITEEHCEVPFQFPGRIYCVKRHPEKAPTAAVIGDSHAFHAYWGLAEALDARDDNLIAIGRGACVPLMNYARGSDTDKCQPHINNMLNYVINTPSIQKVFVVFRGRYLPNSSDEKFTSQFRDGLEQTLTSLKAAGKRVYYFLPIVETGFDPRLCLGNLPFGRQAPQSCELSRSKDAQLWSLLRNATFTVMAHHPEVRIIDPNDYFCQGDKCPVVRNGHAMFKDENHLSYSGSMTQGQAVAINVLN